MSNTTVNSALLLCAGLGTRLRPLTNFLPKCLVPIHGRPLLDYWLANLVDSGISRILINTHHLSTLVVKYVEESRFRGNVTLVYEEDLLGTGGTAVRNKSFFNDEPFILAHADNLSVFSAGDFVSRHHSRPSGCEVTMMTFETDVPELCGIVETREGIVTAFHEKTKNPPGTRANGAVYIFEPSVLHFMVSIGKPFVDVSTEVLPQYLGKTWTFHNSIYHRDIGNLQSWAKAQTEFVFVNPSHSQVWSGLLSAADSQRVLEECAKF